ncbi:Hypothetical predicted protein, partial [Paramuricea clavata]
MRVSPVQLDHFLTFITSPHIIQDLPFGQRNLQLSNGQVIETPNVIRTMIKQRTIMQYVQYCEDFKPFSTLTMNHILTSCSASVRKSLQGLDYISAEGGTGFDDLATITDKLIDYGLDPCNGQKLQKALKEGKQYLKTDFKVHVAQTSSTADHCLSLALSDSKEKRLHEPCDHPHDKSCQSCEQLKTLNELKDQTKILADKDDDLLYCYQQAAQAIESWKSHLLRSVQQDKARTDILELLDESSTIGCYHSVALLCACPEISKHTGIHIKRVDFSDPQEGKGACDRKAATVKGHVRRYINEGHDVATTEGFKDAIISWWDTWNGKSITVWKSYDVGEGRKVKWSKLP